MTAGADGQVVAGWAGHLEGDVEAGGGGERGDDDDGFGVADRAGNDAGEECPGDVAEVGQKR